MSFKTRLVMIVSLLTIALAVMMFFIGKADKARTEKSLAQPVNTGKYYAWRNALEKALAAMQEQAGNLEMAFEIKSALKKGDPEILLKHADVFFNLVKDQGFLTSLQITDPDGGILYSAPESVAGKSTQKSVTRAIEKVERASALEYDDSQNLVLSLAIPIKSRRKLYGIGVYNLDMNLPARLASEQDKSDFFVVAPDGRLLAGTLPELFAKLKLKLPALTEIDLFSRKMKKAAYSVAIQPVFNAENQALAQLVSLTEVTEEFNRNRRTDLIFLAIVVAAVAFILLGLTIIIRRAIKPLETSIAEISAIAQGDLTRQFKVVRKDEIGRLMQALGTMTHNLCQLFGQIASSGENLAENASSQASSIEEISATLQNMDEVTRSHASDAEKGKSRITKVNQAMKNAEEQMEQLQALMQQMTGESKKIQNIVAAINGIASQTNLLAINAGIEAARAGEAGAGFSVVAAEVGSLASKTAESAKEISSLIEQTVKKVSIVEQVSSETRSQFQLIFERMSVLSSFMDDLIENSLQGSSQISELNMAVEEVNRVVHQTVSYSDEMVGFLGKFRFDNSQV